MQNRSATTTTHVWRGSSGVHYFPLCPRICAAQPGSLALLPVQCQRIYFQPTSNALNTLMQTANGNQVFAFLVLGGIRSNHTGMVFKISSTLSAVQTPVSAASAIGPFAAISLASLGAASSKVAIDLSVRSPLLPEHAKGQSDHSLWAPCISTAPLMLFDFPRSLKFDQGSLLNISRVPIGSAARNTVLVHQGIAPKKCKDSPKPPRFGFSDAGSSIGATAQVDDLNLLDGVEHPGDGQDIVILMSKSALSCVLKPHNLT